VGFDEGGVRVVMKLLIQLESNVAGISLLLTSSFTGKCDFGANLKFNMGTRHNYMIYTTLTPPSSKPTSHR
jgi:hypothetical protein